MDSKWIKILAAIAVLAVIGRIAYGVLAGGGATSAADMENLKARYKAAGGFGLGCEVAAKFPGAKVLVLLPDQTNPDWAFYEGFKRGGVGLAITEVLSTDMPARAGKLMAARAAMAKKAAATPPSGAAPVVALGPLSADAVAQAIAKKGADCKVVVSFIGLPAGNQGVEGAGASAFAPWAGMDKTKVAIIGMSVPSGLAGFVKSGNIVAVVSANSNFYKWPKDKSEDKLFAKCWDLITPTAGVEKLP
jgi:hypothetical protein